MAIINAADYDHIDIVNGADTNRHMLKDAQARQNIADLKSALNSFVNLRELFAFEPGSLNVSGQNAASDNRVRTKYMVWCKAGTTFKYSSNNLAILQYSNRAGAIINDNYWLGFFELPQDCFVRIVVNQESDVDAVWSGLEINYISDEIKIEQPALSDTVSKEFDAINKTLDLPILRLGDFESGNIQMSTSGWEYSADQERARTKEGVAYTLRKGTKIHIADGYVAYFGWKVGSTYYTSGGWKDTMYEAPSDGDYVFLIRFATESIVGFFTDNAFRAITLEAPPKQVGYNDLTNQAKRFSLAVSGTAAKLPNYETATKTLTLYSGTRLLSHDGTVLSTLTANVSLSSVDTSNNNVFVYNTSTNEYQLLRFGANLSNAPYIILGEINIYNGVGDIQCGYTINGYPVGSDKLISDLGNVELPDTWGNRVQIIQTAQGKKFTFAIQTDTHFSEESTVITSSINDMRYFKMLTQYIGFDFVANLGDLIQGYTDDTNSAMRSAMTAAMRAYTSDISCPFMIAMGNHDRNTMYATAQGVAALSFDEVWGRMFKPAFNTNPKAITQRGLMYYYTDYNDVRVIVLNTQDGTDGAFGIGATQLAWFTSAALDTNKAVLVLSHVPLVDGWSVASNYDSSFADIVSALQTFIANNGVVIGCMCGHLHKQESKLVDGINYVAFNYQTNRAEVVQVDLENKTINTFMVGTYGSDADRSFTY